jgi:putative DNA primase/helicase
MTKIQNITDFPHSLSAHVEALEKQLFEAVPHSDILPKLLSQIKRVDFVAKAFPDAVKNLEELKRLQSESVTVSPDGGMKSNPNFTPEKAARLEQLLKIVEGYKVKERHKIVIAVDEVLETAQSNDWGLCRNADFVYLYNGAFWSQLDENDIEAFLGKSFEKMGANPLDAKDFEIRAKLRKQFLAVAHLTTPERPKNTILINLENGTFEISPNGQRLRPPSRADFITYQLPFKYDPDATAPRWLAFLNEVQPDPERQKILAEYLGYVFISHKTLKLEKTLLLYGQGANGKSVFFEVVNALLGKENVSSFSLQSLTNDNGYFRAKLANKLVNYASEINGTLETAIFKQLVSGEPVEARLPYGQPFILHEYAKLIFNCNGLPKDVEQTNAYFRRFLIVPFDVTIPDEKQDKELAQKIIDSELSGVFNWALTGLRRLLEQKKFTYSEAVTKQIERYKLESDSVKMFLEENGFVASPTDCKLIKDLYSEYRAFCIDDGFKPVNKTNFITRLKNDGINVEKKNIGNVAFVLRHSVL